MTTRQADARPSAGDINVDFASLEQAAQWYAVFRGDHVTEQDRLGWQTWLTQRPENAKAWQHIESIGSRFDVLRQGGRDAAMAGAGVARRHALKRRQVLNGLASAAGIAAIGWLGWRYTPMPRLIAALGADHRTAVGERRDLLLADGSRIWLNTSSALNVDYRPDIRRLHLLAGEVLIDTATDPAQRPFIIDTAAGSMQALGTRFSVRLEDTRTQLNVFDGTVAIRTATGATQQVRAGQQAHFDAHIISAIAPAQRARESWQRGLVVAEDLPLRVLVEELAGNVHGHVGVAPDVADLPVMGVFPADDLDRALGMLERNFPIRVKRTLPWWTTIVAAPPA